MPGDRLPDTGPQSDSPTVDDLLARADRRASAEPWLYPCSCDELIGQLAAALRAKTAATRSADGEVEAELSAMTDVAVKLHAGLIATVHQQWLKPDAHEPADRYTPMTEAEIAVMETVVALEDNDGN